jgi:hypothetical protein
MFSLRELETARGSVALGNRLLLRANGLPLGSVGHDPGSGRGNREREEEHGSRRYHALTRARPMTGGRHVAGELGRQLAPEILDKLLGFGERNAGLDETIPRAVMLLPPPQGVLDLGANPIEVAAGLGGILCSRPARQDRIVGQPNRGSFLGIPACNQNARSEQGINQSGLPAIGRRVGSRHLPQGQGVAVARGFRQTPQQPRQRFEARGRELRHRLLGLRGDGTLKSAERVIDRGRGGGVVTG